MESRPPVSSPTAIIWETMAGKAEDSLSGVAIWPPDLTDSTTSSMARSMTELPAVWPVTSIACRIGTPAEYRAEKVRDQRASAIFWTVSPSFIGSFIRKASHWGRPQDEVFHLRKATTTPTKPATIRYQ